MIKHKTIPVIGVATDIAGNHYKTKAFTLTWIDNHLDAHPFDNY